MRRVFVLVVLALVACKKGDKKPAVVADTGHYVWDPNTVLLDAGQTGAKEIERIPIGAKLVVERVASAPEYLRVVEGTKKQGFVLARAVREAKPDAAKLLESARGKLAAADLPGAIEDAERVLAFAPNAEALDILEAIHDAQANPRDASDVRKRRKAAKLPEPTPTPDAAAVPVKEAKAGDVRRVNATKLLLKEKPDVSSKTVGELPIDTEVRVTGVKGEWLTIEATLVTPSVFVIESDGLVKALSGEPRTLRGHARPRFLTDAPLSSKTLVAEADAFEAKGDLNEAMRRLERATALDPDPALIQRLASVAAKAKQYRVAARAAARLTRGADRTGELEVSDGMTVYGCRGDLANAVIFSIETDHPDACITNVPTHDECAPCRPSGILVSEAEGEEEIAVAQADYERELAAFEKDEKAWEQAHEEWAKEDLRRRERYPDGPYARIVLPPSDEEGNLFAWTRTASVLEDYCGNLMLGWGPTSISQEIPAKSDRQRTFWIALSDPDNVIFGIESAADGNALQKRIESCDEPDTSGGYASPCAPTQAAFPKLQSCGCCGC